MGTVENDTNRYHARKAKYERAREEYQDKTCKELVEAYLERFETLTDALRAEMAGALADDDMEART